MQDHYKLVTREEEREMLPLCVDAGVDTTPWSPLARGLLTRPYGSVTARLEDDRLTADGLYTDADSDRRLPPPSPPGTA
jgi:aryl-alcohol dehydrogenase-like predicted oxidoreductase